MTTPAYASTTQIRCPDFISLFCDDCGTTFITYDPNAERGHPIQLNAILTDAARHARECPQALSVPPGLTPQERADIDAADGDD